MTYFVEIIERSTGNVETRMGPMNKNQAERTKRGADINLDHNNFVVKIREDVS
jgi:hypothetical protein